MPAMNHCEACGKSFTPDFRNRKRQVFCGLAECQRQRRNQAQRERRRIPRKEGLRTRRLKPSEAAWLKKHPLIIGLISVLMGSTDLNEIETFCAAASERGRRILKGELLEESQNLTENKGFSTPLVR